MQKNDYYYDIIYRLKWEKNIKKLIWIKYKSLDLYLIQLKKQAVSFNWNMIFWIQDLEYLKINKKNYEYIEDWKYITYIENTKNIKHKVDLHWIWEQQEEEDITNKLLFDYWITWEDYYKKWKVLLEYNEVWDSYLYVDSYKNILEEWSKWLELFKLVFTAKEFYKKNNFTYIELKKIFKESWIKFSKLESFDLSQIWINNFLWKKLKNIQDKISSEYKCLEISSKNLAIWQEKAI